MLQQQRQSSTRPTVAPAQRFSRFNRGQRTRAAASLGRGLAAAPARIDKPRKPTADRLPTGERHIELKLADSSESSSTSDTSESSDDCPTDENLIAAGNSSEESPGHRTVIRWGANQDLIAHRLVSCSEFEMTNNCYDVNNNGQGVDMQNLPSIAEQMERQRTWMTIYFRYRVHWYEAKAALCKMSREEAYKNNNLLLWTRCLKVQLHRKTIFLNAIRAFRNRMRCGMSGVRFTMYGFYQDRKAAESREGPEPKPLPYFRCPDDMPELKTMVVAQLNVFVSNSTSFFDQFWDECLTEN
ncbi:hypothetical protein BOX15_Mlig021396g2 [Macrostomum lignano]|uniref:Uncharacterized protein n=1 Tax=Macrostomum lignano TaxID=282301 RepID=A0A267EDS9_9PLAT|nr:hypothetical protein BOX15_Mlig021396g2 [Macrostomum lignano]